MARTLLVVGETIVPYHVREAVLLPLPDHNLPTNQTVGTTSRLRCIACGATPDSAAQDFRCNACGDLLEFFFPEWSFDPAELKSRWLSRRTSVGLARRDLLDQSGVWRFRELLPHIPEESVITLREGNTPLYHMPRCARTTGVEKLYAKHQGMNPTASFKDTGMTFAASSAHQSKFRWVACASTGNTSASMAAYAARGKMHSLVLIPEGKISWGKLSQSLDYGALTCQLRTDFDGCVRILNELVRLKPVYLLNSVNPYRIEGQKTAAIELLEQLGWDPPDHIIVPGGNLGNSSAIGKALVEMLELKLISRLPKLSIIQAQGANPFYRSVREFGGKKLEPMTADTLASAIRIGNPASWKKALRVLEATGGEVEEVSEVEIAIAKAEIGGEGIGCEPASAVTLAGLKKLRAKGFVKAGETVVLILTGHVLKDPDFTIKFHRGELFEGTRDASDIPKSLQRAPVVLDADLRAVIAALEQAEEL
ncbi:MAG TPA: threonine synthase [Terriglobales bacterium]|nr:threonine synthase [Terriglobales bacterium]